MFKEWLELREAKKKQPEKPQLPPTVESLLNALLAQPKPELLPILADAMDEAGWLGNPAYQNHGTTAPSILRSPEELDKRFLNWYGKRNQIIQSDFQTLRQVWSEMKEKILSGQKQRPLPFVFNDAYRMSPDVLRESLFDFITRLVHGEFVW